jgi:hypothetical protein
LSGMGICDSLVGVGGRKGAQSNPTPISGVGKEMWFTGAALSVGRSHVVRDLYPHMLFIGGRSLCTPTCVLQHLRASGGVKDVSLIWPKGIET